MTTSRGKRSRVNPTWGTPLPPVNGSGETTHFCRGCQQEKPVTEFYRARHTKKGHQSRCRECNKLKARNWAARNGERRRAKHREWLARAQSKELVQQYAYERALRTYGYSLEQYRAKLAAQGGVCAICGLRPDEVPNRKTDRFAVDHDHATGTIRDLLCHRCNNGLGTFSDRVELLEKAIEYLKRWARRGEICA